MDAFILGLVFFRGRVGYGWEVNDHDGGRTFSKRKKFNCHFWRTRRRRKGNFDDIRRKSRRKTGKTFEEGKTPNDLRAIRLNRIWLVTLKKFSILPSSTGISREMACLMKDNFQLNINEGKVFPVSVLFTLGPGELKKCIFFLPFCFGRTRTDSVRGPGTGCENDDQHIWTENWKYALIYT